MTWLATFMTKTIKFSDIRLLETNWLFWRLRLNGKLCFYANHFYNKGALLARLTPMTKATRYSALTNL
ncbi:hypothetical protein HanXRQr2_Chr10g0433191 [Helianthus annuus]|uniref:Uncharacterized protein n=1 Tax=Helianthus annuus TaxID=4232 RepID=A0A9K3HWG2_HELAN|nr:hypothetical protein HanXRQr2_Chr10g0433191 [Helianthus annuus]KAJ0513328.1 hypothetical protein HanHA300_Chr10g0356361 [Helianthus annuus]KAJ0529442.1 hypothetical protein HanHA89_Chr10g0377941 [Helianthus annuus]